MGTTLTIVGVSLCLLAVSTIVAGTILLLLVIGRFRGIASEWQAFSVAAMSLVLFGLISGAGAIAIRRVMMRVEEHERRPPAGFEVLPPR